MNFGILISAFIFLQVSLPLAQSAEMPRVSADRCSRLLTTAKSEARAPYGFSSQIYKNLSSGHYAFKEWLRSVGLWHEKWKQIAHTEHSQGYAATVRIGSGAFAFNFTASAPSKRPYIESPPLITTRGFEEIIKTDGLYEERVEAITKENLDFEKSYLDQNRDELERAVAGLYYYFDIPLKPFVPEVRPLPKPNSGGAEWQRVRVSPEQYERMTEPQLPWLLSTRQHRGAAEDLILGGMRGDDGLYDIGFPRRAPEESAGVQDPAQLSYYELSRLDPSGRPQRWTKPTQEEASILETRQKGSKKLARLRQDKLLKRSIDPRLEPQEMPEALKRIANVILEDGVSVAIEVNAPSRPDQSGFEQAKILYDLFFLTNWQMVQRAYRREATVPNNIESSLMLLNEWIRDVRENHNTRTMYLVFDKQAWNSILFRLNSSAPAEDAFMPFFPIMGVSVISEGHSKNGQPSFEFSRFYRNDNPDPLNLLERQRGAHDAKLNANLFMAAAQRLPPDGIIRLHARHARLEEYYRSVYGFEFVQKDVAHEWDHVESALMTQSREGFIKHLEAQLNPPAERRPSVR